MKKKSYEQSVRNVCSPDNIQQKNQRQENSDFQMTEKSGKISKNGGGITTLAVVLIYLFLLNLPRHMLCLSGSYTGYFIFVALIGIIPVIAERFIIFRLIGVAMVLFAFFLAYDDYHQGNYNNPAKQSKAKVQIEGIEMALKLYKLDNNVYPTMEQGLKALIVRSAGIKKWREGGYLEKGEVPKDPWGNDYVYLYPGNHGVFDIISYGADSKPGGKGKDINNWEL